MCLLFQEIFFQSTSLSYILTIFKGFGCKERCADTDDPLPLCTAATDPYFDQDTWYSDSIFSQDPVENPAFFDYNVGKEHFSIVFIFMFNKTFLAFVPYCSSDCYTGTKNSSLVTDGLTFHGKYIFNAILDDLIKNTWIVEAEEVSYLIFSCFIYMHVCRLF